MCVCVWGGGGVGYHSCKTSLLPHEGVRVVMVGDCILSVPAIKCVCVVVGGEGGTTPARQLIIKSDPPHTPPTGQWCTV